MPKNRGTGRHNQERGFILPLSLLFVVVLTISGLNILHLDFLERKVTLNEVDNHGAFYLASTGIERARENLKITIVGGSPTWTPVLNESDPNHPAGYPTDGNVADPNYALLCPDAANRGCVIPPFQTTLKNGAVIASDGNPVDGDPAHAADLPFAAASGPVLGDRFHLYSVRAFNNIDAGGPDKNDDDGILTFRALGEVRGERKVIELNIRAVSGLKHVNCGGPAGSPCPDTVNGNPPVISSEGRAPASSPISALPTLNFPSEGYFPLTNALNYYRQPGNFAAPLSIPPANVHILSGDITLTQTPNPGKPDEVKIEDNSYYITGGDIRFKDTKGGGNTNVVVVTTGGRIQLGLGGTVDLTNAIIVAQGDVDFVSGVTLRAPLPYPAIISGHDVTQGSSAAFVFGNIYAIGTIDANPVDVHGVLIALGDSNGDGVTDTEAVQIQGSSTYTDQDGGGNTPYYEFMPGFYYPDEVKTTVAAPGGTWREIQ